MNLHLDSDSAARGRRMATTDTINKIISSERTVLAQADGTSLQDPHVFVLAFWEKWIVAG